MDRRRVSKRRIGIENYSGPRIYNTTKEDFKTLVYQLTYISPPTLNDAHVPAIPRTNFASSSELAALPQPPLMSSQSSPPLPPLSRPISLPPPRSLSMPQSPVPPPSRRQDDFENRRTEDNLNQQGENIPPPESRMLPFQSLQSENVSPYIPSSLPVGSHSIDWSVILNDPQWEDLPPPSWSCQSNVQRENVSSPVATTSPSSILLNRPNSPNDLQSENIAPQSGSQVDWSVFLDDLQWEDLPPPSWSSADWSSSQSDVEWENISSPVATTSPSSVLLNRPNFANDLQLDCLYWPNSSNVEPSPSLLFSPTFQFSPTTGLRATMN